jgi:hypothetical protein
MIGSKLVIEMGRRQNRAYSVSYDLGLLRWVLLLSRSAVVNG